MDCRLVVRSDAAYHACHFKHWRHLLAYLCRQFRRAHSLRRAGLGMGWYCGCLRWTVFRVQEKVIELNWIYENHSGTQSEG
jgi:hypothetical protein